MGRNPTAFHLLMSRVKEVKVTVELDNGEQGIQMHKGANGSLSLNRQEKMNLKMSSAEVVCCKILPDITDELSKEANSVDPEQTAPIGAV